jgi:tRNA A-37 threonylcarbamoyl transferase component Bud32
MTDSPNLLRGRTEPVAAPAWVPSVLLRIHFWLSEPPEGLDRIDAEYYAATNWTAICGLFGHIAFLVVFTALGPNQLALLNIWSVAVWGVTLALAQRGRVAWAFVTGTLEVVVHSAYASLLLGWDAAFQYYYLIAALLWVLNRGVSMGKRLAIATSICLAVVAGAAVLPDRPPSPVADPLVVSVFGVLNLTICLIMAFGVALYLPLVIDHARAQLKEAMQAGSYELERVLDRGGMGEVWLARHRMLVRPAAVKLIRQEEASAEVRGALKERFEREAQATAVLRSVHTVELYDYGITDDDSLYYAMELLDGIDLDNLVKTHGPVDPGRVVYLLRQVCDSLADAHANGLVHRDIKPANLYICRMGTARDFVKVLDFGLVKSIEEPGPAGPGQRDRYPRVHGARAGAPHR